MSRQKMWKIMWLKVRYGWKSYLFYLFATILFITVFLLSLRFSDDELNEMQSLYLIGFLYVPVAINQAIPTIEYSKCYYLVPRTSKERKRFIRFQNHMKMLFSVVLLTILLGVSTALRPEAFGYLLSWYMISGVAFTLVMGCNGYSMFHRKKKKKSYASYMVTYIITVIVMIAIMYGGMYLMKKIAVYLWMLGGVAIIVVALAYYMYNAIRFRSIDASYENIDNAEQRFMTKMSNSMM